MYVRGAEEVKEDKKKLMKRKTEGREGGEKGRVEEQMKTLRK